MEFPYEYGSDDDPLAAILRRRDERLPARSHGGSEEFPYEYGSDLHWLWGWGHVLENRLRQTDVEYHQWDCGIFRPCRLARDAMTRFSVGYPFAIKVIDDGLTFAEKMFAEFLADPESDGGFGWALHDLRERIATSVKVIADGEAARNSKPAIGETKPTKPGRKGPTADEINDMQAIQRDWLAYTRHCREKRLKLSEGEAWQSWRAKHGKSDKGLSPEYVTRARKRFKEHVREHPEDNV